jgi:adenine deaminase
MLLTNKYDESERRALISVCLGLEPPDLVVTGGNIVDVATGEVRKADVAVKGSRIAVVGDSAKMRVSSSTTTLDVSGKFVAPGFFDPHAHVESTMLTPSAYSSLVIPHGTTGAIIDPHEVANVSGIEGVEALWEDAKNGPFKFMMQVPSCVPSAPGLETSGHTLGPRDVEELLGYEGVHGLGEVMSYDKILDRQDEVIEKIRLSYERRMVVDGHSPPLRGERFQAYASSGVMTDHTARTDSEVLERLRSGSQVMIQDRPSESSFESIIDALRKVDTRRAMFCTDDIEPDEVQDRGHLDSLVRKAVRLGLDPVKAIQMATLNVAEAYHAQSEFGIIAPGRYADLLVLSDLQTLAVEKVILNGWLAASEGSLLIEVPKSDFQRFKNTVRLRATLRPNDLVIKVDLKEGKAMVRVVTVDGGIVERQLEISDYEVLPDPSQDVARMTVLERHGRNGNIGKGFIFGTGLRRGAIATSVSHDAHNLAVIGFSKEDMMIAVKEVERMGGGIVAVTDGVVRSRVELPYFGLLNDNLMIAEQVKELRSLIREMGLEIPLRKLMFLCLPVGRGNFRITDVGVVDYANRAVLSSVLSLSS